MKWIDDIYSKNRDYSLDVLRALACIMVIGVHFTQRIAIPSAVGRFFEKGSTGVSFFFILSGYLAYVSLERLFQKENGTFNVIRKFWLSRAAHILPLYFLIILFYFILYTVVQKVPEDSTGLYWIRYILMLNLWIPSEYDFWINLGAVWSISVFVLFYLLAPFLYLFVRKYYVAWAGVIIGYAAYKVTENVGTGRLPFRFMFYFLMGILIYLAEQENKDFRLCAVLLFLILFCFLTGSGTAVISPAIAAVYVVMTRRIKPLLNKWNLCYKVVTFISVISYSLYLIHVAVLLFLDEIFDEKGMLYVFLFVLLTLGLSCITYVFVETKFARKLMGIWSN
ncbi:acyltransferase family protein [Butyrivibrio sp. AE2032]|uniref:acyltransferase family protein n=1 Tax=Butyrivibrio sp. AE2032 TaxID=1458463 RepID=UPI00054F6972|nr:acyltransferase [Butyrivibrio sp. AE2032]